jgi:hypothetical protein
MFYLIMAILFRTGHPYLMNSNNNPIGWGIAYPFRDLGTAREKGNRKCDNSNL